MIEHLSRIERKVDLILSLLQAMARREIFLMATVQQLQDDVTQEKTLEDSLVTLTSGLKKQLDDALAQLMADGASPQTFQAKIDEIFAQVESNKKALSDALVANTLAPTPTP